MVIGVPKEDPTLECRVVMLPKDVKRLIALGAEIRVESGTGETVSIPDSEYAAAGAQIQDRDAVWNSDVLLKLRSPGAEELDALNPGSLLISYLQPFEQPEFIRELAQRHIDAICMELIPRSTRAQKMDALSSQASLAGYAAVILAAAKLQKAFPMMTTPAGTIQPSRVFIVGAGVAGLQAIATAKRLGARVDAFDTRPVVAEQVRSLGARFVEIDLGETGQSKDGYAKALTPEQLELQRQGMAKQCALSDVIITTAQVFGRKAPRIITADMIAGMQPGSVIVDLAAETGGNVEGSLPGKTVVTNGVHIIGVKNLPAEVALHASQMYSANLYNFIEEFWDKENKTLVLDSQDEIIAAALVTRDGEALKNFDRK